MGEDEEKGGLLVLLEQMALPEIWDLKAQKDHLELTVFLEYLAYMDKWDHLDCRERKASKELMVILESLVIQERRVN